MCQIINQNSPSLCSASCTKHKAQSTKRSTSDAFTLIEMLIVLVIFSVIGMAIFTTLSNGMDIWERLNQGVVQDDINLLFEQLARDLRNTFEFSTIKFQGEKDKVAFASFVTDSTGVDGVGQVVYHFNKTNRQLIREKKNYSQIYKDEAGKRRELSKDINQIKFTYYSYDEQEKEYIWQEEWQQEGFPLAVRVELEFHNGQQVESIIRTIDIPISQS